MKKISRIIKNEEDKQITIIFYDYEMLEIKDNEKFFNYSYKFTTNEIIFSDNEVWDYNKIKANSKVISGTTNTKIELNGKEYDLICGPFIISAKLIDDYTVEYTLENGEKLVFTTIGNYYFKGAKIESLDFEDDTLLINDMGSGVDTLYPFS